MKAFISIVAMAATAIALPTRIEDIPSSNDTLLAERQVGPSCFYNRGVRKDGDGNPHQNYFYKQLSPYTDCGTADNCGVGQSDSISYSIGFSASATAYEWISGGFSVSESVSTGNSHDCGADHPGERVCMWKVTAHTAYTVFNTNENTCGGYTRDGDNYVMYSPNSNNAGSYYLCRTDNDCGNQGDSFWVYDGRAGGP